MIVYFPSGKRRSPWSGPEAPWLDPWGRHSDVTAAVPCDVCARLEHDGLRGIVAREEGTDDRVRHGAAVHARPETCLDSLGD